MRHSLFILPVAILLLTVSCNNENGPAPVKHSKWISRVVEYRPAPGQFINTGLGNTAAVQGIVGGKNGCLSLGGFGGYVIFEFDHDVQNIAGTDFVIFGNAFKGSSEPGIVEVSPDGSSWYRLKGSEDDNAATVRNYTITYTKPGQTVSAEAVAWTDDRGGSGEVGTVTAHPQSYWPLFLPDDPSVLIFSGIRLPDNSAWNASAQKFELGAFAWGYADNRSEDYEGQTGNDPDTRSSNKFDLDNAVDASGNAVSLTAIRQVKVYTALCQMVGAGIGETSTEICGALSLSANL